MKITFKNREVWKCFLKTLFRDLWKELCEAFLCWLFYFVLIAALTGLVSLCKAYPIILVTILSVGLPIGLFYVMWHVLQSVRKSLQKRYQACLEKLKNSNE